MIQLRLRSLLLLQLLAVVSSEYVYGEPKFKCPKKSVIFEIKFRISLLIILFFFFRTNSLYPCVCEKGSDDGLFVRCENVNLATLAVALQNLASFQLPIEELTIYRGHFGMILNTFFTRNIYILCISLSASLWSSICQY